MTLGQPSDGVAGSAGRVVDPVGKAGYELAFEETFDGNALDQARCP